MTKKKNSSDEEVKSPFLAECKNKSEKKKKQKRWVSFW